MSAADEKGFSVIGELFSGLLKNPALIEGIIAGVSALSASRKIKLPDSGGGFDIGSIIGMLPQMLPLVSGLMTSGIGSADKKDQEASASALREMFGEDGSEAPSEAVSVMAVSEDASDTVRREDAVPVISGGADISYGSAVSRRENLLLAIRPFLSESRVAAADAMLSVNRISGVLGI